MAPTPIGGGLQLEDLHVGLFIVGAETRAANLPFRKGDKLGEKYKVVPHDRALGSPRQERRINRFRLVVS